ncbi:MAG: glycogen debranching protein GlgX [Actinomycetaceae bacterium]|nr:glycogen debranching protein GlgX [Actinomycetaceae bacterium]
MSKTIISSQPNSEFAQELRVPPLRLGVHPVAGGLQIAVCAPNASALEFCVFDSDAPHAGETRYQLHRSQGGVFSGQIFGLGIGTVYGLRAYGPWDPENGHVFNPQKLLLDPYARGVTGKIELVPQIHGHETDADMYPVYPLRPDTADSAPHTVRAVVTNTPFAVAGRPQIPWNETVIYEAHVRGLTENFEDVPGSLRGTYAGVAHPATVEYIKSLGITTLELLPIHAKFDEAFLLERGLTNYWGYSTLGFFAPEPSLATAHARRAGPQAVLDEVRGMVSILHQAGIEVILDVVYNHTCEGGVVGQYLSLRGLDSREYYMHVPGDPGKFYDVTGCGNSLDFSRPRVRQLALDSLRYWAGEVGVDGFRFDLAVTLGRFHQDFSPTHPMLDAIATDPLLANLKIIAEPWDIGENGWQTGGFARPFSTWNDRYRDSVRAFWVSDARAQFNRSNRGNNPQQLATRLSGSVDLYGRSDASQNQGTRASINFVTAHDGFTLADLVSYNDKHNEDNLEENRDGTNNNLSWNHGYEGWLTPTDPDFACLPGADDILSERTKTMRNIFGTLLVSAGIPMIVAGDEFGRTQNGNNNAYCQDNETSWLDWNLAPWQRHLQDTVRYLLQLRKAHPVMRPQGFAKGLPTRGDTLADLSWYDRKGHPLSGRTWVEPVNRALQMLRSGKPSGDQDLLVVINGTSESVLMKLASGRHSRWELTWDSTWENPTEARKETVTQPQKGPTNGQEAILAPFSLRFYLATPIS